MTAVLDVGACGLWAIRLEDRVLSITGTDAGDVVNVSIYQRRLLVLRNGRGNSFRWPTSLASRSTAAAATTVNTGSISPYVLGDSGNDTLIGGGYMDNLVGGGNKDHQRRSTAKPATTSSSPATSTSTCSSAATVTTSPSSTRSTTAMIF